GRTEAVGRGDGQGTGRSQGAHRPGDLRGFQPRRQDAGLGGRDVVPAGRTEAVGRGDGQGTGRPQGTRVVPDGGGLQPRRQDAGLGGRGRDDHAVGPNAREMRSCWPSPKTTRCSITPRTPLSNTKATARSAFLAWSRLARRSPRSPSCLAARSP